MEVLQDNIVVAEEIKKNTNYENQHDGKEENIKIPNKKSNHTRLENRKIVAEDKEWNLFPIKKLSELCITSIVKHFANCPVLNGLPRKFRKIVLNNVNVESVPLEMAALMIPDEEYWKRVSISKWSICDVSKHGGSWKRLFFENYIKELIENFIPGKSVHEEISKTLGICQDWVISLNVEQLQIRKGDFSELKSDHLELDLVLKSLPKLESLHITYGIKNCGMDFAWNLYGCSITDCKYIANSLKNCFKLNELSVRQSLIEDAHLRMIVSGLLENNTIKRIDFSHNKIANEGIRALAHYLSKNNCQVSYLNLSNNLIGPLGAKYLAESLIKNERLEHLNIGMNGIRNEGFNEVMDSLNENSNLRELIVTGNGLDSEGCMDATSRFLRTNCALVKLDISANNFDSEFGKAIIESLKRNKTLRKIDLRQCGINADQLNAICYVLGQNNNEPEFDK
ncbi:RNI-like protein [Rozella allomycis CSF55]|uniref:RNI-like protein n=1 Tax=Rozella allomycis (strain CSF55) TaxID=988480 RepID=A0A4P9YH00_ROZAC|nr:RNI-like protein [Rozella allomycis CSF55]